MSDQTFRLLVLKAGKQTRCVRESELELMRQNVASYAEPKDKETKEQAKIRTETYERLSGQLQLLQDKGQWREVWLHEPVAEHDEKITALCLVDDPETGRKYDPTLERAARCEVMVDKWNGFPKPPSIEAYRGLESAVARKLSLEIEEWLFPSGISADFLDQLSCS